MIAIREAVVVEGRYDKASLSQVVDAVILETSGFGVFKDNERLALLRRLAAKRGLIVLTDSDGAGFVIRNYLKGAIPPEQVKHAYIPDVYGKERRKRAPGKDGGTPVQGGGDLTPADLFALGLSGTPDAAVRRAELLRRLGLPEHMSAKALLTALNALYTPEELDKLLGDGGDEAV